MNECVVEVRRGVYVESIHRVHVVVVHADDGVIASAGNPRFSTFVRSAVKMFQALPLVEDGGVERYGLTNKELAVCTASHGGEPFHVAAVRAILQKTGISEAALACGPHPPMHGPSADTLALGGAAPDRIHNNCSGKHAGMLALAKLHGWPLDGYHRLEHPVQQRVLATLASWCRLPADQIGIAIDGCGLPTFSLPLEAVALACARLSAAAAEGVDGPARVLSAMTAQPLYVAGTDRLDTDLMRVAGGRLFAKVGAEGYYCAGAPEARLGLAMKIEDGTKRASEPALLAVLRAVRLLNLEQIGILARYVEPAIRNTRGEHVGEIRARAKFSGR